MLKQKKLDFKESFIYAKRSFIWQKDSILDICLSLSEIKAMQTHFGVTALLKIENNKHCTKNAVFQ